MAAMGLFSPAGVAGGTAGPAWARGEVEAPQGARRTATGYAVAVYTPEQHLRTLLLNSGHEDKFVRGSWEDAEEAGMANHLQAAEQWKARHTARSPSATHRHPPRHSPLSIAASDLATTSYKLTATRH